MRTLRAFCHSTSSLGVLAALVALLALNPAAHAAPSSGAQQLITEGLELRRAGQDTEALVKFEEAYKLTPSPRAAAQWGLCLQAVGRWSEADVRLSEALKAKNDPWVSKNRGTLKESLEQVKQKVARVEINGGPDGATISINGRYVGIYPLPGAVAVNAGTVDIEVTKPGFKRVLRSLSITGGQYQRVLIRLEEPDRNNNQELGPPQSPPPLAAVPPQEQGLQETVLTPDPSADEAPKPIYKKPWFWAVVGAVVVGGGLAIGLTTGSGGSTSPRIDERGTFDK